jgi:hypothetical protein
MQFLVQVPNRIRPTSLVVFINVRHKYDFMFTAIVVFSVHSCRYCDFPCVPPLFFCTKMHDWDHIYVWMAVNINCRKKKISWLCLPEKMGKRWTEKILPSTLFSHDVTFYMYHVHLQMFLCFFFFLWYSFWSSKFWWAYLHFGASRQYMTKFFNAIVGESIYSLKVFCGCFHKCQT